MNMTWRVVADIDSRGFKDKIIQLPRDSKWVLNLYISSITSQRDVSIIGPILIEKLHSDIQVTNSQFWVVGGEIVCMDFDFLPSFCRHKLREWFINVLNPTTVPNTTTAEADHFKVDRVRVEMVLHMVRHIDVKRSSSPIWLSMFPWLVGCNEGIVYGSDYLIIPRPVDDQEVIPAEPVAVSGDDSGQLSATTLVWLVELGGGESIKYQPLVSVAVVLLVVETEGLCGAQSCQREERVDLGAGEGRHLSVLHGGVLVYLSGGAAQPSQGLELLPVSVESVNVGVVEVEYRVVGSKS